MKRKQIQNGAVIKGMVWFRGWFFSKAHAFPWACYCFLEHLFCFKSGISLGGMFKGSYYFLQVPPFALPCGWAEARGISLCMGMLPLGSPDLPSMRVDVQWLQEGTTFLSIQAQHEFGWMTWNSKASCLERKHKFPLQVRACCLDTT